MTFFEDVTYSLLVLTTSDICVNAIFHSINKESQMTFTKMSYLSSSNTTGKTLSKTLHVVNVDESVIYNLLGRSRNDSFSKRSLVVD